MECEIGDFKCLGLSLLGKLVPYLGEPFVWLLAGVLLASTWLVRKLVRREWELLGKPGNEAFRRKVAKLMVKRPLAGHYMGGVQWLLRGIDHLFGPIGNNQTPGGWIDRLFGCQPLDCGFL